MRAGRHMNEKPKPRIVVELDDDVYAQFRTKLIADRMTMADFIRKQVDAYLMEGESDGNAIQS